MRYLALLMLFSIWACSAQPPDSQGELLVFASILPQKYFVERIGGGRVAVEALVGAGQSPHSYEPTPKQMAELAHARIYFAVGVPFEKSLLAKIRKSYANLTVVQTQSGILAHDRAPAGEDDAHEEDHPHGIDPHIWLSPRNVRVMAGGMCEALERADPENAPEYQANLAAFRKDLHALDRETAAALVEQKGKKLFVYHPAFGHYCSAYGLEQVAVETDGKEPSARQLGALLEMARKYEVKVIFSQPQFARTSAATVAREIGGSVVTLDPLARDYIGNLRIMTSKIRDALAGQPLHPGGPSGSAGEGK